MKNLTISLDLSGADLTTSDGRGVSWFRVLSILLDVASRLPDSAGRAILDGNGNTCGYVSLTNGGSK